MLPCCGYSKTQVLLLLIAALSSALCSSDKRDQVKRFRIADEDIKQEYNAPWFCHGIGCPYFKVLNKTDVYEEREYEKTNWISTDMTGIDFRSAEKKMFMKLFNYIQGANEDGMKIKMTAPVLVRIIPGAGPACENNFTMSFFLSAKVSDPPKPNDKSVYFSDFPAQTVFVKSFGGFAFDPDKWLENASELAEALVKDGKDFFKKYFHSAGYDSPFRIFNRHNEVWYLAK